MLKQLRSCIGPFISSLQLKHFGKNRNKNGADDYPARGVDAVGCLVAVFVITEGEDIEAFPLGPSREYLRGKYHCTIDLLFDALE
jgi:hypothetical protein